MRADLRALGFEGKIVTKLLMIAYFVLLCIKNSVSAVLHYIYIPSVEGTKLKYKQTRS